MAYSTEVLEASTERATRFLSGIGAVAVIRTLLAEAGMTDEAIIEGRDALFACLAAPRSAKASLDTDDARAQRASVAELDQWDEPNFGRFSATLKRHHPSAGAYIFTNLSASTGVAAVEGIATFLTRVDALEGGTDPERQGTMADDRNAVALLAERGLTKAERVRLRALVHVALSPTGTLPEAPFAQTPEERIRALTALREWYDEWAATARAVVKKKSYLIRLGLANRKVTVRKSKSKSTGTGTGTTPTPTAKAAK
jgi:hypothetical protein